MVFNQILIVLVAFLGFPVGHLIAHLAHDEIETGKVFFKLLRVIMLLSAVFFLFFYSQSSLILIVPAILLIFFLVITFKRTSLMKELAGYLFLLLSLIATFFVENTQLTFLVASLIFVYLLASVAVLRK